MRSFAGSSTLEPVPGDVVALLRRIDLASGSEAMYADQLPQLLIALRHQARIESVTASSALEGIVVDESRIPKLASGTPPRVRNRSEAEFAGYSTALDYLLQGDAGEITVGLMLHLHRLLFSLTDGRGGHLKTEDNLVIDRLPDGTTRPRFTPVSWKETPFFMDELAARTRDALTDPSIHPLLVVAAFALDLLCIHPFADGNGRVARLTTGHLLERSGYGISRYVSLEQLIFETKDDYYAALAASTAGWLDQSQHSLWPWARYLLERISDAYERFEARVAVGRFGGTKQDRVRDYVLLQAPSPFTIADIRRNLPGVSDNTIRLVLAELKRQNAVRSDGTGRNATWQRER